MSETVDLFRQIAEALSLTPGELLAFSKIVLTRRAEIREQAELAGTIGSEDDQADGPVA